MAGYMPHRYRCVVVPLRPGVSSAIGIVAFDAAEVGQEPSGTELVEKIEVFGPAVESHLIHRAGCSVGHCARSAYLLKWKACAVGVLGCVRIGRSNPPSIYAIAGHRLPLYERGKGRPVFRGAE